MHVHVCVRVLQPLAHAASAAPTPSTHARPGPSTTTPHPHPPRRPPQIKHPPRWMIWASWMPFLRARAAHSSVGTKQRVTLGWNHVLWQVVKSVTTWAGRRGGAGGGAGVLGQVVAVLGWDLGGCTAG